MTKKLINGQLVDMGPAEEAAFDAARSLSLPQLKKILRARIAARRVQAENGGFVHLATVYASTGQDLARLTIIAQRARTAKAAAAAFSVRMVAVDESESAMSADEVIALEVSAGDHFVSCGANARTLRQAVNAAADEATAKAVDLDAGWP